MALGCGWPLFRAYVYPFPLVFWRSRLCQRLYAMTTPFLQIRLLPWVLTASKIR